MQRYIARQTAVAACNAMRNAAINKIAMPSALRACGCSCFALRHSCVSSSFPSIDRASGVCEGLKAGTLLPPRASMLRVARRSALLGVFCNTNDWPESKATTRKKQSYQTQPALASRW